MVALEVTEPADGAVGTVVSVVGVVRFSPVDSLIGESAWLNGDARAGTQRLWTRSET